MRDTSARRHRSRTARGGALALTAGLAFAALPAGTAAAWGGSSGTVHVVTPGQSIQKAVDGAKSGDTIKIAAGTYHEAVCIEGKGLTVIGAGADRTVIAWQEWQNIGQLRAPATGNACWQAQEDVDAEGDPTTLADDVSGLFFLNPDKPVTVGGLQTRNHPANGIVAWGARGFNVGLTKGVAHDRYGILAADSTQVRIAGNVEKGLDRGTATAPNAGTAGISLGDSDQAGALIAGNHVSGYNLGIFLRESRGGKVVGNTLTGNCIGLLAFDDLATEIPDNQGNVEGGAFDISGNTAAGNNRYCLQGRNGDQHVSGVGMQLVNVDSVKVRHNKIRDHAFRTPAGVNLTNPAAGLNLISLRPFGATGGQSAGLVTGVQVVGNTFGSNLGFIPPPEGPKVEQVDVFVSAEVPGNPQIPFLNAGPGIDIRGNSCDGSLPRGICPQG